MVRPENFSHAYVLITHTPYALLKNSGPSLSDAGVIGCGDVVWTELDIELLRRMPTNIVVFDTSRGLIILSADALVPFAHSSGRRR